MNKGQMELSYEEIQMELDLRGSEVYMADSQGIKVTGPMVLTALGVEPGSEATMLDSRQIVVTGVPVQGALAGTRVMETLGINVEASDSDNDKTFKRMSVDTGQFTPEEFVVWLQTLSKIRNCKGLGDRAEDIAKRFVVDEEMNEGRYWLREQKDYWLTFMTEEQYDVLERFGFNRGPEGTLELRSAGNRIHSQYVKYPAVCSGSSAGDVSLEALSEDRHDVIKGMTNAEKLQTKQQEQQDPVDVSTVSGKINAVIKGMTNAEKIQVKQQEQKAPVDASTTSEKITEVTKEYPAVCSGSSAGNNVTLEALMTLIQQIDDDTRAGDGTLEVRKTMIQSDMVESSGHDGTWLLERGEETPSEIYSVYTQGVRSTGAGIYVPEAWRDGIPHMFAEGQGAIMIGTTGENESDAGGFIIDPGSGENISTSKAEKITAIINGMTHDEKIHVKQQEQFKDDARRFIIDPGGEENMYEGSWRKAYGVTQCTGNKEKLLGINDNAAIGQRKH